MRVHKIPNIERVHQFSKLIFVRRTKKKIKILVLYIPAQLSIRKINERLAKEKREKSK